MRIVFDASLSTTPGISLNENLEAGKNLNLDVLALIMNFCKYSVTIVTDMEKTYFRSVFTKKIETLFVFCGGEMNSAT